MKINWKKRKTPVRKVPGITGKTKTKNRVRVDYGLLAGQIIGSVLGRKGRAALTASGIAVGVVVFIMTYGWSLAAGSIINAQFDKTVATLITVKVKENGVAQMDDNFTRTVKKLDGVVAAGRYTTGGNLPCRSRLDNEMSLPSVVADPGYFQAAGVIVKSGRIYDQGALKLTGPAAVLGPGAAKQLGIEQVNGSQTIICNGVKIPVYGILKDAGEAIALAGSVILSKTTDGQLLSQTERRELSGAVRTELGATQKVANMLPKQVSPYHYEEVSLTIPPSPEELRKDVTGSVNTLAVGVSVLSLVVGGGLGL